MCEDQTKTETNEDDINCTGAGMQLSWLSAASQPAAVAHFDSLLRHRRFLPTLPFSAGSFAV